MFCLCVFWFTCCRTTCSSTHHFIYTHIKTHLMDPSKTWLHIFITSTRNLINQQINSLLMEAARWWRRPADGGSSVMEAARWWRQLGLDNMSCISFTATADWWWRTTSYWTTGPHLTGPPGPTRTPLTPPETRAAGPSAGLQVITAARPRGGAENGRRVGVGELRAGSVGKVSVRCR